MTSNILSMGFISFPNMVPCIGRSNPVPWLFFNVNILCVRASIVTDQFCWMTDSTSALFVIQRANF